MKHSRVADSEIQRMRTLGSSLSAVALALNLKTKMTAITYKI